MNKKQNIYDLTPKEIQTESFLPETNRNQTACMFYLEFLNPTNSNDKKLNLCTKILTQQKPHERFSQTKTRLGI